jgi:hypothetical protein
MLGRNRNLILQGLAGPFITIDALNLFAIGDVLASLVVQPRIILARGNCVLRNCHREQTALWSMTSWKDCTHRHVDLATR